MPLYEYECIEDGEVIELLRPVAEADRPVTDPAGRGRTFRRRFSAFAVGRAETGFDPTSFQGCPCGDPDGPCNR
ncbi:MAG: FmdB family zinc ribbon protein [Planctomycetota bacterium]|jgi:putative FmdB family regulatory protein